MALVVFTGGARSGKSSAAERLARVRFAQGASVTYVAFARADAGDPELAERVARHRADRGDDFVTLEARDSVGWYDAVRAADVLLLDCLGTLVGQAMEESWAEAVGVGEPALAQAAADSLPNGVEAGTARRLDSAIAWLLSRDGDTIVVTNEVGDGVVPAYASGRLFRDLLGRANRRLVDGADAAYLCVAGRLIALETLPRDVAWPRD